MTTILRSEGAPFAYKDAFRADESNRRLWQVWGFVARRLGLFPCALDLDAINFIQHGWRKGTSPSDHPHTPLQDTEHNCNNRCQCHPKECWALTYRHKSRRIWRPARAPSHLLARHHRLEHQRDGGKAKANYSDVASSPPLMQHLRKEVPYPISLLERITGVPGHPHLWSGIREGLWRAEIENRLPVTSQDLFRFKKARNEAVLEASESSWSWV